jgi:hypothetical protein
MDLPSHPEANDSPDQEPTTAGSRALTLVVAAVVALAAVLVVLHLTGVVGPAAR